MKCKFCGINDLNKYQESFCSSKCANRQKSKIIDENRNKIYAEIKNKILCSICNRNKEACFFSLKNKYDYSLGLKECCRKCWRNKTQKEKRSKDWKDDARKALFNSSKNRAKIANLEFTITKDDIIIPDFCPVLGIELKREAQRPVRTSPSIDRIDNTKGYVKDNIIVVSIRANRLKKDATITELIQIANFYKQLKIVNS